MGRRKGGARVLGPYREEKDGRVQYRVVQLGEDGTRTAHVADTERQAKALVRACWIDIGVADPGVLTVSCALDEFLEQKRKTGAWSERTFERTGGDLKFFVAEAPDAAVGAVNVLWVRNHIERMAGSELALASQRSRFHAVSEFLGWSVRKGYLKKNPCDLLDRSEKPWVGKRARRQVGRGKPQLRNVREVEAYLSAAAKLDAPDKRVAAMLPVLAGMRSGEVRYLRVGDVDFVGGKLWLRGIDEDEEIAVDWDVKTASSRRTVDLPEVLRKDLTAICKGRPSDAFVFPSTRKTGEPFERKWLNRLVTDVCGAAKTRIVCAHGLRDTYTSLLAALASKSSVEIAALVGHGDQGQTARRHYIGVPEHRPVLRVVHGRTDN